MILYVSRAVMLSVLLATLIVVGTSTPVWAAQLDAQINPKSESSPFKITYLKTIFIEYPEGGDLFDELQGKEWTISGTADFSNSGVQTLVNELNRGIANDGSQAQISDLNVSYDFHLKARNIATSIDYRVLLDGTLSNYIITDDGQKTLVDLGWRGLTTDKQIIIDGHEINIPLGILKEQEPQVYAYFAGTEAENVLGKHLIDADFILEQPIPNWHFLFDPTGINVDAATFGLNEEIAGSVISKWTMGESSFREGIQTERVLEAEIIADKTYSVRSVQSTDQATLSAIGFGASDVLDGVEIIGVTPKPPPDYGSTSTGSFPVQIIYGMAGIAAVAGIAFFFISSRSLKNELQGQQGIDPNRLVGYQTSASSGGYQTNRGEAHLKDDADYQQTRTVYEETSQQSPPPQATVSSQDEAACGCAASAEMGSECDCAMQSACLCDGTCKCGADICKDQVHSMS